jgi:hypothetical protein
MGVLVDNNCQVKFSEFDFAVCRFIRKASVITVAFCLSWKQSPFVTRTELFLQH